MKNPAQFLVNHSKWLIVPAVKNMHLWGFLPKFASLQFPAIGLISHCTFVCQTEKLWQLFLVQVLTGYDQATGNLLSWKLLSLLAII